MNVANSRKSDSSLGPIHQLSELIDRLERSPVPVDPDQFRAVAQRLEELLRGTTSSPALRAILNAFPSAKDIYENIQYEHAGLCLSPLDAAIASEAAARDALDRVRQNSRGADPYCYVKV